MSSGPLLEIEYAFPLMEIKRLVLGRSWLNRAGAVNVCTSDGPMMTKTDVPALTTVELPMLITWPADKILESTIKCPSELIDAI